MRPCKTRRTGVLRPAEGHIELETGWHATGDAKLVISAEEGGYVFTSVCLLISAPSLGVYYCQQLTLPVCLSVTNFKLLLLFLFLDGIEPFLAFSSP